MIFEEKLRAVWQQTSSMLCVGLDPDPARFPDIFQKSPEPVFEFNKFIIDSVADLVCAFKPQIAHYAAIGAERQLEQSIQYIRHRYPQLLIILDAKRGDIGSTAQMYAQEAFERYDADAVTMNPYMGDDAIEPFLVRPDRGAILLCRTSNSGARQFQDQQIEGRPLYGLVAKWAEERWRQQSNIMLVVGAGGAQEMADIRKIAPHVAFLVPGIGEQGGDPATVVRAGLRPSGDGLLVSSSRAIIYAGPSAEDVRLAATDFQRQLSVAAADIEN